MTRLFSKSQRKELYRRAEGQCEGIGPKYGLPEGVRCMTMLGSLWQADHDEPDACGGKTSIENGVALCIACHAYKTGKGDIPRIAKNRRVEEKAQGIRRSRRGFATNRDQPWKQTMDGRTVRR